MLEGAPDGNRLFRCILDQLNHDGGSRHEFTHPQITNHISRNGNNFKDFLLSWNNHEGVSNLYGYLQKMGKNDSWGGPPEVYAAAWFYGIDITIYAKEYASTGGNIVFKADEPDVYCNADHAMWFLS